MIEDLKVKITKKNVRIIDSYKITDTEKMKQILNEIMKNPNYKLTRKINDLIDEWQFHNFAYKIHLFRKHSKDVDLSENESLFRRIVYKIFGMIRRVM